MTEAPVSPLRRRVIEDMSIRKFAPRTQEGCIRATKDFSAFLGASPDKASFEDLPLERLLPLQPRQASENPKHKRRFAKW